MSTAPLQNLKIPRFFGRLYGDEVPNGACTSTWVRAPEVDALESEIERLRRDNAALRKELIERGHTDDCLLSMDSGYSCKCGFDALTDEAGPKHGS